MGAEKKRKNDWKNIDVTDWETPAVIAYIRHEHEKLFGIKYIVNNQQREAGMIKNMVKEHGPVITKMFIDECFKTKQPTNQYPVVTFGFMSSWMKERVLPRVLAEKARERAYEGVRNDADEDLSDWI